MNRVIRWIFVFAAMSGQSQNSGGGSGPSDIAAMEKKSFEGRQAQVAGAAANNYNIIYNRCAWSINPVVKYINGEVVTWFIPTVSGLNKLEFDLTTALTVDSVKYHQSKIAFSQSSPDLLTVNLPGTLPKTNIDSVAIYYQGVPNSNGLRSFVQSEHNQTPIIWTLSQPFGARDWWPCKQSLSDKIDSIDILVTTPLGNRVASNGLLVSEKTTGNNTEFHWKSRYPIAAYLVAIGVTNYTTFSNQVVTPGGTLQVLNYVYPESYDMAKWQSESISGMIRLFDSLTIPYPFSAEKYGHAQFGASGGMEHQTMTFIQGYDYSLMAHECAHQWFGDYITCGSWRDIWLNEGFATYFEGLCLERYNPKAWVSWKEGHLKDINTKPDGSVLCDDTASSARIFDARLSYIKGAFLLHMLRWKLGDALFFKALKNYLNDPALRQNYAKTPDLIRHMEATGGQQLTTFFNQWYYGQGHPDYEIKWQQNNGVLRVTINQSQSHPSVSFFEMPLPLRLVGRVNDTIVRLDHAYSGQTFTLVPGFLVTDLEFDPKTWLISGNNTVLNLNEPVAEELFLKLYPNPTEDEITITGFKPGGRPERVEITDGLGRLVYNAPGFDNFQGKVVIGTSMLAGGAYTLRVTTPVGNTRLKFIKR